MAMEFSCQDTGDSQGCGHILQPRYGQTELRQKD